MRTVVLPFLTLPLSVLSIACGGDPAAPAVHGPGHVDTTGCTVVPADAATGKVSVSEGGRARVALTLGARVTAATVGSAADGLEASVADDGSTLVLKPAYGSGGQSLAVSIALDCGGAVVTQELEVEVRRIAWSQEPKWTPKVDGPLSREYGSMWIDAEDPDRLLVFGGFHYEPMQFTPSWDLWSYDIPAQTWQELTPKTEPPHMPGGRIGQIPGERAGYYYGGLLDDAVPYSLVRFDYGPDALTFSDVAVDAPMTSGDYLPAFVYDAPRNRYIAACGANEKMGYHCKVRAFHPDTKTWETLDAAGDEKPKGRNGLFYVHDEENQRLVMFSGEMGGTDWECNCAEDTWALELAEEPVRWVKLAGPQTPPLGRRNGAFALDPVGHRMFIWGGTPDGAKTFPGLYAFDLDRGAEHWSKVETEMVPPERTSGVAVYDAARSRLLLGFGNDAAVYADLWALNL